MSELRQLFVLVALETDSAPWFGAVPHAVSAHTKRKLKKTSRDGPNEALNLGTGAFSTVVIELIPRAEKTSTRYTASPH